MDSAYRLVMEPPAVDDYLRLRKESGLSARTREEAENGVDGAWASACVIHVESGETVGMGRVLSDGGRYFHLTWAGSSLAGRAKSFGQRKHVSVQ